VAHLKEDAVGDAEAQGDKQTLEDSVVMHGVDLGGGVGASWRGGSKADQGAAVATTSTLVGRGSNSKTAAQSP
jgi:diaminopimelate decarboxylase